MRATRLATVLAAVAVPLCLTATDAGAQRGTTRRPVRRQQPIEIRGQVPTPQVVTVRPREVPAYSRRVLVPNFYDHDFWPVILPGYQLVPGRMIAGNQRLDSLMLASAADSARQADSLQARAAIGTFPIRPRAAQAQPQLQGQPQGQPQGQQAPVTPPGLRPPTTANPGMRTPATVPPRTPGDSVRARPDSTRAPGDTTRSSGGTPPAR